jgi:predicted Rossmann fold flavoprotein
MTNHSPRRVVVIGGGAAGFFASISAARHHPQAEVWLLEKNRTLLNKVRISGGGRCNVTHDCPDTKRLAQAYPRGGAFLRPLFQQFGVADTIRWFEQEGVTLKTEADGRMFPTTDSSETIVYALQEAARRAGVRIRTSCGVKTLRAQDDQWHLEGFDDQTWLADAVIVTTGGNPQLSGYDWLAELGLRIVPPVPSLFTFNVPDSPLHALSGVSVPKATVRIAGRKQSQDGPLLVTHWGFSGPAVLKMSAWAARDLADLDYTFTALTNWVADYSENQLREYLLDFKQAHPKKVVSSNPLLGVPTRLWAALCQLSEIDDTRRWVDLSNKQFNKLLNNLLNFESQVKGKTTFKEEFVTAGGVDLNQINGPSMAAKQLKGLFFAGEVLDVDAVTGGFNFQAAWTTGWVAGKYCLAVE